MISQKNLLLVSGLVLMLVASMAMPVMAEDDAKEKAAPAMGEMMKEKPAAEGEKPDGECAKPGVCPKCGCSKEKMDDVIAVLEKAEKAIAENDMAAAKTAISQAKMHLKMMAVKCGRMEKGEKGKCPMCKPGEPCPKCAAKMAKEKAAEKPADAVEPAPPAAPAEPAPAAPAE